MTAESKLIAQLVDVATGKIRHTYQGACPEVDDNRPTADRNTRDGACPACQILILGDRSRKLPAE